MEENEAIVWETIEPLVADLSLDRDEVEKTFEALVYAWNRLFGMPVASADELIEAIGADTIRELLYLLSAHRMAEVA